MKTLSESTAPSTPNKQLFNAVVTSLINYDSKDNYKAIKQSFFNCFVIVIAISVIAGLFAIKAVLEPFLRPLLWSVLIGSVLHPFKYKMLKSSKEFLDEIEANNESITINSLTLPIRLANYTINYVMNVIRQTWKLLLLILITLLIVHLSMFYFTFTHRLIGLVAAAINCVSTVITLLQSEDYKQLIVALIVVYVATTVFYWNLPGVKRTLILVSPLIWLMIICQVISVTGKIGVVVVSVISSLVVIGVVGSLFGARADIPQERDNRDQVDNIEYISHFLTSGVRWLWNW